jgi:Tol biopolymer transport system component
VGSDPTTELWLVHPDGSGAHRIVVPFAVPRFNWSPDGRYLTFPGSNWPTGGNGVWVIGVDGTGLTSLTPECTNDGQCSAAYDYDVPTWHPDGRHLIYKGHGELRVVRRDGSPELALPNPCGWGAQFSPNGQRIAAVDTVAGTGACGLVVMNADGGGRVILDSTQSHLSSITDLAWRP